jgi:hypothetical protein
MLHNFKVLVFRLVEVDSSNSDITMDEIDRPHKERTVEGTEGSIV